MMVIVVECSYNCVYVYAEGARAPMSRVANEWRVLRHNRSWIKVANDACCRALTQPRAAWRKSRLDCTASSRVWQLPSSSSSRNPSRDTTQSTRSSPVQRGIDQG